MVINRFIMNDFNIEQMLQDCYQEEIDIRKQIKDIKDQIITKELYFL